MKEVGAEIITVEEAFAAFRAGLAELRLAESHVGVLDAKCDRLYDILCTAQEDSMNAACRGATVEETG
jgi:hypothetical protein